MAAREILIAASTASVPLLAGHHRRDRAWGTREQLLGEHTAEQRHPELGQVCRVRIHRVAHGRDRLGMVASDREHAVAAEQIEVAIALGVDQMGALPRDPALVEPERAHDPPELRIEIGVVERHLLAGAAGEDLADRRDAGHTA